MIIIATVFALLVQAINAQLSVPENLTKIFKAVETLEDFQLLAGVQITDTSENFDAGLSYPPRNYVESSLVHSPPIGSYFPSRRVETSSVQTQEAQRVVTIVSSKYLQSQSATKIFIVLPLTVSEKLLKQPNTTRETEITNESSFESKSENIK